MERWIVIILLLLGIAFSCVVPVTLAPQGGNEEARPMPEENSSILDIVGTLNIEIQYDDDFYVDTFNYTPDAPNVRHYVLIVPESDVPAIQGNETLIFINLQPQEDGNTAMSEDRVEEFGWVLDYLYDAPNGVFSGTFPPGTYGVASAFLLQPLSREESGVGDDAVLWAGVTGGGANTTLTTIELESGESSTLIVPMTDANGWACPWLYVFDGENYVRYAEVLRNLRGEDNQRTETTDLLDYTVIDGAIHLRISEEKEEISYIDSFYLLVDGEPVYVDDTRLSAIDGDYLILHEGDSIDLRFPVPMSITEDATVQVVAHGYYEVVE